MANIYAANVLIGGGSGALDSIDGAVLSNLDAAIVTTATGVYHYTLDADSGASESSPDVITPDTNAGTKRWVKVGGSTSITTVNAATYTVLSTDLGGILNVTYTDTGTVLITIPSALIASGKWALDIKDADFNAGTNNITIATGGAETIDESATTVISWDGGALSIYCDTSNLFIY